MAHHSYVTVILLGDAPLTAIRESLKSVEQLHYPHDMLECLLLLPPQKPQPRLNAYRLLIRTIQFDLPLDWSVRSAVWEGLDFSRGELIQILSGKYRIHPDWLADAGQLIRDRRLFGVTGQIDGKKEHQEGIWPENVENRIRMGLFDRGFLRYVRLRENWLASTEPPGPPLENRLAAIDRPMAWTAADSWVTGKSAEPESGWRNVIRKIIKANL